MGIEPTAYALPMKASFASVPVPASTLFPNSKEGRNTMQSNDLQST